MSSHDHLPLSDEAANDNLEILINMMSPGLNILIGNEELESVYLDYRASVLDQQYEGAPNYFKFENLPDHKQK